MVKRTHLVRPRSGPTASSMVLSSGSQMPILLAAVAMGMALGAVPVSGLAAEPLKPSALAEAVRNRDVQEDVPNLEPGVPQASAKSRPASPADASSGPVATGPVATGPVATGPVATGNASSVSSGKTPDATGEVAAIQSTPAASTLTPDDVAAILADADAGDVEAQFEASLIFYNGEGVSRDVEAAAGWAQKAAEQGHIVAARTLAALYYSGEGVPRDYAQAAHWFEVGAEGGSPDAQYGLGLMYLHGQGLERDLNRAERWFSEAAGQDHLDAQFQLGLTHFLRNPANYQEAKHWYEIAAKRNHPGAQTNLGALYLGGLGVAQDGAMAYMWISLAADQEFPKAKKYLELAKGKLEQHEVTRGKEAAALWKKAPTGDAGEASPADVTADDASRS